MIKDLLEQPRRICIFGGTGFVGEGIVPRLLSDDHEIFLLVRSELEIPEELKANKNVSWSLGDATDQDSYREAGESFEPDTLIYLIGLIREFPKRGITWEKLHYQAFVDAVMVLKDRLKKVVYMSADVARSEGTGYETTKWRAEEFIKRSGIDYTIFRPTIIMAPSAQYHFTQVLQDLTRTPVVPIFGTGSFKLSPVSRADVAEAFAKSLKSQELNSQVFDLKGSTDITYRNLVKSIRDLNQRKGILVSIPLLVFKLLGKIFGRFVWFPFTNNQISMLTRGIISDDMKVWTLIEHAPLTLDEILVQYKKASSGE